MGRVLVLVLILSATGPLRGESRGQSLDPARDAGHVVEPVLSLAEAMATALQHSPALQPGDDAVQLAAIATRREEAQFGLRLSPNLVSTTAPNGFGQQTLGLTAAKRLLTGADLSLSVDTQRWGLESSAYRDTGVMFSVSQPLLRGGWTTQAATAGLVSARRAEASAARAQRDARQALIVRVTESYFAVVRADHARGAAQRFLERARHLQALTDARSRVGAATRLDVLRAELLAAQAGADAAAADEAAATARDELNVLLGRPLDSPVALGPDALAEAERLFPSPCGRAPVDCESSLPRLIGTAIANRHEPADAKDRVASARLSASVARLNLLPPVTLDVSYTRRGLGAPTPFSDFSNGWRVGITSAYPLDRGAASAAADAAEVTVRAAERAVADAERQVVLDVRQALRSWQRAAASVAMQQHAADIAARQVQMAALRFERGLSDTFELVDAELSAYQAEAAVTQARIAGVLAAARLARAAGLLDPERLIR
jgi:multidrug efflux system outer membrane protein